MAFADAGGEGRGKPPVIMVHGAFAGGWCFERFRRPFEAAGHAVDALDLPGHSDGEGVYGRSMRDYADFVVARMQACAEPPILLGHSMGGLVCQMAAGRAKAARVVLVASSPPWGQGITGPAEIAAAFGLWGFGPYFAQAISPDWSTFRSLTLDRLDKAEAQAAYARMVPESGRAMFEVLNWWLDPLATTFTPPNGPGCPVLAMTGEADRIHSPATVQLTAARIGAACRIFPHMSHWTIAEPGWEAVAGHALEWLAGLDARATG